MTMRRQRCTECNSVFYTQDPKVKICGTCAPEKKPTPRRKAAEPKPAPEPQAATQAPDATE